jgi:hypothetical protein
MTRAALLLTHMFWFSNSAVVNSSISLSIGCSMSQLRPSTLSDLNFKMVIEWNSVFLILEVDSSSYNGAYGASCIHKTLIISAFEQIDQVEKNVIGFGIFLVV